MILERNYVGSPTSKEYSEVFRTERKNNPHLFKTVILSHHADKTSATEREHFLLSHFNAKDNPMYINKSNSGKNYYGSNPKFGKDNANYGNKYSIETRRKLSIANKGKNNPMWGKKNSSETIAKRVDKNSKIWKVTFPSGEIQIIKNMAKFCREHGIHKDNMYQYGHSKGFRCVSNR
jgi:hypothetical protein